MVIGAVTKGSMGCRARCVRMEGSCPILAVVNEEGEEMEEDDWGYGLGADERVIGDWEKNEEELIEARMEEVKYMVEKLGMFDFYSEEEMKKITNEAPTSTKWVDVRKMSDDGNEFMRSRLVARDFKPKRGGGHDRADPFAAMPRWRRRRCSSP